MAMGQAWSGVVDSARATDWTNAGLPGGIPTGQTNCTTAACNLLYCNVNSAGTGICSGGGVSSGQITSANITSAIASAPNDTVVRLPATGGTITLTGSTPHGNRGHVVLRGAGPTQTKLLSGSGSGGIFFSQNGSSGQGSEPNGPFVATNWTGGLTKGSTILTLASTSGISAGQNIILDQLNNTTWIFLNGVELGTGGSLPTGNSTGRNGTSGFGGAANRAQMEMVHVVSVDSSTQITIAAPGVQYDHSSGLTPQAFAWNAGAGNIQYVGIENLSIDVANNDFAVSMPFCDYCWLKNVQITNTSRAGVYFWFGYRDEMRDSYVAGANVTAGPTDYGIEVSSSTFTRVENNVTFGITSNVLTEDSVGTVIGYNYTLHTASGNQIAAIDTHLAHNYLQLWEGNSTSGTDFDNSWGSASQITLYRNWMSGVSPNKTNFRTPVQVTAHNYYMNVIGNVLGTVGYHTRYRCDNVDSTQSDNMIYNLGFWNSCINGIDASNPYDTKTLTTLYRWANWDSVSYAAAGSTNGVHYCTGSGTGSSGVNASNASCGGSEVPTGGADFPQAVPASTTLPDSFYLAAKPSWFGSVAWPAIGPDVSGGNVSNTAGHANKIPAQLCYENGAKNGSGYLTAFDATTCYAASGSSSFSMSPSISITAASSARFATAVSALLSFSTTVTPSLTKAGPQTTFQVHGVR
jgi:hypothetical protein